MMPDSTHHDESSRAYGANASNARRRSQRLALGVPVVVRFQGSENECRTLNVSPDGALLFMLTAVNIGQSILLINPATEQKMECYIRSVTQAGPGINHVGVEFATESSTFWGIAFGAEDPVSAKRGKRWLALRWPAFALLGFLALVTLFIAKSHRLSATSGAAASSASRSVEPEDSLVIPGVENYRVATPEDFDPDATLWLRNSGQQASGEIPGMYSTSGQSHAYVLIGKDNSRRVVILAGGRLRCDAPFLAVAIATRISKDSIQKISWAGPPPAGPEGDGLLIVRAANNVGSGVVLFLGGDQVVLGTPVDYRQTPVSQTP